MYYPDHVVEDVRMGNDIVDVISEYVSLSQKGSSYFGLCPFHNESTPSFSVSPDKQLYHCFGCGASGNVYSFVMQRENLDFPEAIKFLADRIRYTLPEKGNAQQAAQISQLKNSLLELHTAAARFYYNCLTGEDGGEARAYLDRRQVHPKTRIKFGLGYAADSWNSLYQYLSTEGFDIDTLLKSGLVLQDKKGGYHDRFRNRLMFPILDVRGRVIGFGGRIIGQGEPKYLNSPETPIFEKRKTLYGLNFARQAKKKELILVEGYMDVISLYEAGINNAVAALGTAFNPEHVKVLNKYADTIYILFDGDDAGKKAALRAIPLLTEGGLKTKVVQLKDAKDPDEFVNKFGLSAFQRALAESISHIAFQIQELSKGYDLSDTAQKIDFTKGVSGILAKLQSAIELEVYLKEASEITGISMDSIKSEVAAQRGGSLAEPKPNRRTFTPVREKGEKQLKDAQKGILFLAAESMGLCKTIQNYLTPEEMMDPVYGKLLGIIYDVGEKDGRIYPAELINHFEDPEEQKAVSDIFHTVMTPDDRKLLVQALNDQIKIVKKAWISEKAAETADMAELQKLMEAKRNIEKLNITFQES